MSIVGKKEAPESKKLPGAWESSFGCMRRKSILNKPEGRGKQLVASHAVNARGKLRFAGQALKKLTSSQVI